MEQNAVRAAAGLEALDHAAGLRIDHDDGVAEEVRRIDRDGRPATCATSPVKSPAFISRVSFSSPCA